MTIGISEISLYLPVWGVPRAALDVAIRGTGEVGADAPARRIAGFDEDGVTLAWEALNSVAEKDNLPVWWNNATLPMDALRPAGTLARVLPGFAGVTELRGGPRGGWDVLAAGVVSGQLTPQILTASSISMASAADAAAKTWSDAGAAIVLAKNAPLVIKQAQNLEFPYGELRQLAHSGFLETDTSAFSTAKYLTALKDAFQTFGLAADQTAVGISTPFAGLGKKAAKAGAAALVVSDIAGRGYCGAADGAFVLADLVRRALADKIQDLVLMVVGDGLTFLHLQLTGDQVPVIHGGERDLLHRCGSDRWRQFRRLEGGLVSGPTTSPVLIEGDAEWAYERMGSRCKDCGTLSFPSQSRCHTCGSEQVSPEAIAPTGEVFTFTIDHLHPSPASPTTMIIADMQGGGRVYLQGCDDLAHHVEIGMPVEMVLRRIHDGEDGRTPHYFWKLRGHG